MSTIAMKNTMVMNNTESNEKAGLTERFKNYLLDNATYFGASSAIMNGNAYAAAQIMKGARR